MASVFVHSTVLYVLMSFIYTYTQPLLQITDL